jgi:hypothetical protein
MEFDYRAFAYVISLAAVINGLGLVRLLGAFAEYLRNQGRVEIANYWVFNLWVLFQFLLHILLWWSLWNMREIEFLNFGMYLYLLAGPVILYLGTSLLVPNPQEGRIELRIHYFHIRPVFFTVMGLFWLWGIFSWPVIKGVIEPTVSIVGANLCIAVILRFTDNPKAHAALVIAVWALLIVFIAMFGMQLGGVGEL